MTDTANRVYYIRIDDAQRLLLRDAIDMIAEDGDDPQAMRLYDLLELLPVIHPEPTGIVDFITQELPHPTPVKETP